MNFNKLLEKAKASKFGMWKLNFLLQRFIPFNRPHGLEVLCVEQNMVQVKMPYQSSNLNHIRGLHACGLATAAEYSSGLLLLSRLGMKKYRIIMESIEVKYFYQGKSDAIATFELSDEEYQNDVLDKIAKEGVAYKVCTIHLHDSNKNLLCTANTNWQIKSWKDVKTKVS
jgi:acyl-coenzyme A thioesterase PaaI-like protein